MTALTHEQKLARNKLAGKICERGPGISYLDALVEASADIRRAGQAAAGPSVAEVQRLVAKATRKAVKARLREALTAAGAPKPPPGTGQAAAQPARRPAGRAAAPAKQPHQMTDDELKGSLGSTLAAGTESPFWQAMTESAPPGGVAETGPASGKPLHQLDQDELRAATAVFATGGQSPFWAGAGND